MVTQSVSDHTVEALTIRSRPRPHISWPAGMYLTSRDLATSLKKLEAPPAFQDWVQSLPPNYPAREALIECVNTAWLAWLCLRFNVDITCAERDFAAAYAPVRELYLQRDQEARAVFRGQPENYEGYMNLMKAWVRREEWHARRQYVAAIWDALEVALVLETLWTVPTKR